MSPWERAVTHVAALAIGEPAQDAWRVTLHFHPDRLTVAGEPILVALVRDGIYRSQFETGTSNGGLTAHAGGDRWGWESRMFGGAYDELPATSRPRYGSLNFRAREVGGSPRFGSAHLRLAPHLMSVTTFCYPDSVFEPAHFGVWQRLSTVVRLATRHGADPLDDYVEAQVHAQIDLARDVEALVLDPCYVGTETARQAQDMPCPVEWHAGFQLEVDELRAHPDYRGPQYVALGESLAVDGRLDAGILGRAAGSGDHDPQAVKRVWHYVARFGSAELRYS